MQGGRIFTGYGGIVKPTACHSSLASDAQPAAKQPRRFRTAMRVLSASLVSRCSAQIPIPS